MVLNNSQGESSEDIFNLSWIGDNLDTPTYSFSSDQDNVNSINDFFIFNDGEGMIGEGYSLQEIVNDPISSVSANGEPRETVFSGCTMDTSLSASSDLDSILSTAEADHSYSYKHKDSRNAEGNKCIEISLPLTPQKTNEDNTKSLFSSSTNSDNVFTFTNENGDVTSVNKQRKNAELAKMNRLRKKRYVSNLEAEVKSLRVRNQKLMTNKSKADEKVTSLEKDVLYLRSVIANETTLSSLLNAISTVPGIEVPCHGSKINNKEMSKKRLSKKLGPPIPNEEYDGGVCLHVSSNKVDIQFCQKCSFNNP